MKEKIDTTAPQKKTYKAVFLDWDDTIGDWVNAAKQALQDIYATYHLEDLYATFEDYLEAYEPYNLMLWGKYGQNEITKEYLQFERFYRPLMIQPEPTLRGRSKEEIAKEIGVEFLKLTNRYFSLLPDADVVVRQLAAKYPLTIISNGFGEVQYYKLAHSGLQNLFTHLLISEEVGINKPQPEIFRIALERNGVTADEAVMIGDSYNSDIAGAKAAGIDQIWIHQGETSENATYIVPTLKDVLKLL